MGFALYIESKLTREIRGGEGGVDGGKKFDHICYLMPEWLLHLMFCNLIHS